MISKEYTINVVSTIHGYIHEWKTAIQSAENEGMYFYLYGFAIMGDAKNKLFINWNGVITEKNKNIISYLKDNGYNEMYITDSDNVPYNPFTNATKDMFYVIGNHFYLRKDKN